MGKDNLGVLKIGKHVFCPNWSKTTRKVKIKKSSICFCTMCIHFGEK